MTPDGGLKRVSAEIRSNHRLRWGLWAILGIVWLYAVLLMRDAVPREIEQYQAAARKMARIQSAAAHTEWIARRDAAMSTRVEFESRLWDAPTLGLAQASFHDWLNQVAQQAHVAKLQVQVAGQEEAPADPSELVLRDAPRDNAIPSGLWKVSARMSFEFSPETFQPVLKRISTNDKQITVESLTIRSTPVPRADLMLVTYFRAPRTDASRNAGRS